MQSDIAYLTKFAYMLVTRMILMQSYINMAIPKHYHAPCQFGNHIETLQIFENFQ